MEAGTRRSLDFDNLSSAIRRSLRSKQPTAHDSTEMSHVVPASAAFRGSFKDGWPHRSGTSRRFGWLHCEMGRPKLCGTATPVAQFLSCKKYFEVSLAILFDFFYRGDMMPQLLGRACCLECDFRGRRHIRFICAGPCDSCGGRTRARLA